MSSEEKYEVLDHVLHVRGFPDDMDEKALLKVPFSLVGNAVHIKMRRKEGRPPSALIWYGDIFGAEQTIRRYNGHAFRGSTLEVKKAKRRVTAKTGAADNSEPQMRAISPLTSTPTNRLSVDHMIRKLDLSGDESYAPQDMSPKVMHSSPKPLNAELTPMSSTNESYGTPKHVKACPVEPMFDYVSSSATIDDVIDENLLSTIFSYLTLKQRFGIQRVCHSWRQTVKEMMTRQQCITFGLKRGISCGESSHRSSQYNDLSLVITEPNGALKLSRSVEKLAPFIRPMRAVECIHFCECLVSPIALKWIVTTCENLRCLRFDNIQGLVKTEWTKFVKPLSAKLIHFSYAGNTLNDWKSLSTMVSSFASLESLVISDCVQDLVPVFRGMSQTLDSLTISRCDRLNAQAVWALDRRNGPQIRFLAIDFTNITNCLSVIQAFYDILEYSLLCFIATNIADEDFTQFTHDLTKKSLTIVFSNVFHNNNPLFERFANDLRAIEMRGPLSPNVLNQLSAKFPVCRELRLNGCDVYCDCGQGLNELLDGQRYSCVPCYKSVRQSLFDSNLEYFSVNGSEYER